MVSTVVTTRDGRHICPNCQCRYHPTYATKESAPAGTAAMEQHITGLCSDNCWDEYLGLI